jgi:thioredoxin-dependent peroxiredoxin
MASPQVGDLAPDFSLDGTAGTFRLSEHRGERVVLLFYPGDNTAVCTRQFCSYRDEAEGLEALDATVVGISTQSVESHRDWTAKHGLTVPLLADPGGKVARAYGTRRPLGRAARAVVIVDEQGLIGHRHDHLLGLDFQTVDDLREALESMSRPRA